MSSATSFYNEAKERYAHIGVDTDKALEKLKTISLSLHCWQADDVGGFENSGASLDGGLAATGNFPGKARNMTEMKNDLFKVFSLIPGKHKLSLHAFYGDFRDKPADRDSIGPEHFRSWVEWAKHMNIGIDFNSTFFSHPKAASGFTLAHQDKSIRDFWIEHTLRCREISEYIGKELKKTCIHNIWIPDGAKDITLNRFKHRALLKESLDRIFEHKTDSNFTKEAIESKLFGIGSESFVAGSHEFYLGYAIKNNLILTLDIGHFHPTESCADKVSSVFQYVDELLFHVTRGIRWDSDHVVLFNDPVAELMQEIVWADKLDKVYLGLDYFDASINRIGAYVIGARASLKALLAALLTPVEILRNYENEGRNFEKLALLEELKTFPVGSVWDYYCEKSGVPAGADYIKIIKQYEEEVLSGRG